MTISKGDHTRDMILRQAAQLFNRRGFFGAAMSDLMAETGLEKGGIYNHFKSKEDLAFQAFDFAVDLVRQELIKAVQDNPNTLDRLVATIAVFEREAEGYPLAGGCPIMNTAIEADDAHPGLRRRAQLAMDEWHEFVRHTIRRGQAKGEIRSDVDAEVFSTVFISMLEGAIMQSKLYGHQEPMRRVAGHLRDYIERQVRAS
jgi:AcrR family transcriptional regulator